VFGLANELFLSSFSFAFQPVRAGKLSGRSRAPSSADALDSGVSSPPRPVCRCDEHSSRIADLESRLTLSKRQAQMAVEVYKKNQIAHLQRTIRMQLSKLSEHHVHVK
jgi:hypothetical protein